VARESSLWASFAKSARREISADELHMSRVENLMGAGFPDVEGYYNAPWWLELKSSERPARPTTPVRFKLRNREEQIEWLRKRWELGGNAFFLLQVGSGAQRILYLAPGNVGDDLKRGIPEARLACLCIGTGVFKPPFSSKDILNRVVSCRNSPYRKSLFQS